MEQKPQRFLNSVYGLTGVEDTDKFYQQWAQSYDEEVQSEGYITPKRCAEALAAAVTDTTQPVLDIGCGSGLSGIALQEAGFKVIDGIDMNAEMLELARARNIYRRTIQHDLSQPLPVPQEQVGNVTAVGVFGPGHAPCQTIDHAIAVLPPGGVMVFSINDHALADPGYENRVNAYVDSGSVELVSKVHGDHLPGIGLKAMVYTLRRR